MNIPSQTIIDVLTFLLPGFVSAALLHSLTPTPHPIPFERVVQALIFTIVIQAGTSGVATGLIGIGSRFGSIGLWSEQTRIVWSLVLAGLLGVVLAWIQNTDQLHSRLRKLRIITRPQLHQPLVEIHRLEAHSSAVRPRAWPRRVGASATGGARDGRDDHHGGRWRPAGLVEVPAASDEAPVVERAAVEPRGELAERRGIGAAGVCPRQRVRPACRRPWRRHAGRRRGRSWDRGGRYWSAR